MANFAGVTTPDLNYSAKEVHGIKRLLKQQIGDVDLRRKNESMIGQNFNFLPKITDTNWNRNVPPNNSATSEVIGVIPANDGFNNVIARRQGQGAVLQDLINRVPAEHRMRLQQELAGSGVTGIGNDRTIREVRPGQEPGQSVRENPPSSRVVRDERDFTKPAGENPRTSAGGAERAEAGESIFARRRREAAEREERFGEIASSASGGGNSASSSLSGGGAGASLRPAQGVAGQGVGGAVGGAGGGGRGRGRPASPVELFEQRFAQGANNGSGKSAFLSREAAKLGIDVSDPSFRTAGGKIATDRVVAAIRAELVSLDEGKIKHIE
jgi:hypothetical protein